MVNTSLGWQCCMGVNPYPNVQQGLKLPLMHPKSAGHKIPFCSHCHLLIPSRFVGISEREGEARESQKLGVRSRDKLAKPLRWFLLKLAVLPVGSINSELAQTLTSMGGLGGDPRGPTIWKTPVHNPCFHYIAFSALHRTGSSPLHPLRIHSLGQGEQNHVHTVRIVWTKAGFRPAS